LEGLLPLALLEQLLRPFDPPLGIVPVIHDNTSRSPRRARETANCWVSSLYVLLLYFPPVRLIK
ncbi:MAG: hypothetical protein M3478_08395, partial [Planctomycetota bacterium]|nr:hypothetical protein [Planctomycetota bacterium]